MKALIAVLCIAACSTGGNGSGSGLRDFATLPGDLAVTASDGASSTPDFSIVTTSSDFSATSDLARPADLAPPRDMAMACQNCPGTCCTGTCVDTNSDPLNCGGCGMSCANGDICQNQQCLPPPMDLGFGGCACTKTCQLACLAGCCLEDILQMTCTPSPNCLSG